MAIDLLTDGYLDSIAVARCFDASAQIDGMLAFECALANAQAGLGIIPATAAATITRVAAGTAFDHQVLREGCARSANAAIPFVQQLTSAVAAVDPEAARYVHWGATSQDVIDNAMMGACRRAFAVIDTALLDLEALLVALIKEHRRTPMVARTLSQHAGPITFAFKVSKWLQSLLPAHNALRELDGRLPVQFGGASGTLAALAGDTAALTAALAAGLGLTDTLPWQTERTIVRDIAAMLGELGAGGGKVAGDLLRLMQTEVDELSEADAPGRGGSSALPHKRNPVASIGANAAARRTTGLAGMVFAGFDHEQERAVGAWQAEQRSLIDLFCSAGALVEQLITAFDGLQVRTAKMRANLHLTHGLVMSEAVVMALAADLGRPAAQALVKAASARVVAEGLALEDVLAADSEVVRILSPAELARCFDPLRYLGQADRHIDTILASAAALRAA